jgi:PAS domain S-box-containing protein
MVGMPIFGRASGGPVVPVVHPILDDKGEVDRLLVVGLRLDSVVRQALSAFESKDVSFSLVDHAGRILFRAVGGGGWKIPAKMTEAAANIRAALGRDGFFEGEDEDGVQRIFALAKPLKLAAGDLSIVAGVNRRALSERVDQAFVVDIASILAVASVVLIVVAFLAQRLVQRPVVELGRIARKLSTGDFSAKTDIGRFRGEFVPLAAAFNEMAACLQEYTQELRSREERLRLMTSCVKDYAIVMLEPDGRIATWNESASRMTGFSDAEVIGRPVHDLYVDEGIMRGSLARLINLASALGQAEDRLMRLRKDGSQYHASVTLGAMRDSSGSLIGFTEITRDISEQVRQEARRAGSANRIRELLRRIVSIQEAERRALSAELHDFVGQQLGALGIEIENVRRLLPENDSPAHDLLDRMARSTAETMQALRSTMAHLRPPLLDDYGVWAALVAYCREVERRSQLKVLITEVNEIGRLPPEVELALFRIVQEAVTNSVKHSKGSQVHVTLEKRQDALVRVSIEDDGTGFVERRGARAARRGGWGLQIMRERAQALGGIIRVEFPPMGTRVVAEVPLADSNHTGR